MRIDMQDTQPLLPLPRGGYAKETLQERYPRLKAFSDRTGMRLLFVYLLDERVRLRSLMTKPLSMAL